MRPAALDGRTRALAAREEEAVGRLEGSNKYPRRHHGLGRLHGLVTPRTDYLHALLGRAPLALTDLVFAEVLQGFTDDEEWERARKALRRFELYNLGGLDLALASAVHQRILRQRGETLPDAVGCLQATFCIQNNFALLHADPGFGPFERHLGLKVPDPGTPL